MSTPPSLAPAALPVGVTDLLRSEAASRHFAEQRRPVDAVPTPLSTWNRQCRDDGGGMGLARGWHVTIAANTGAGKSLLALNVAAEAIRQGERVGFVSLEMSQAQVATRLYAILTDTDVRDLERGQSHREAVAKETARRVAEIRERTGGGFIVNADPIFEIERIAGLMRYLAEEHGCGIFVVDYLQLAAARDADSLFRQVSNVSARVREFAKRMRVVTIGLSQLNRSTSADYGSRPRVQGLMASSSLENDSDQVLLLDHTRYRREEEHRGAATWAILGKNRHGGTGDIPVWWDYRALRIREARPDEEEQWP